MFLPACRVHMSVAHNRLTVLPREIGTLLHFLLLHPSPLIRVPFAAHLTRLVKLDASHNQLTDLPTHLGHCDKIQVGQRKKKRRKSMTKKI